MLGVQFFKDGERVIRAAVIDVDDLIRAADQVEALQQLLVELRQAFSLIIYGDHDGYFHWTPFRY